jgi:hypothetical protein
MLHGLIMDGHNSLSRYLHLDYKFYCWTRFDTNGHAFYGFVKNYFIFTVLTLYSLMLITDSINIISQLLLYLFVNILQIRSLLLLLNTFWQETSRLVTLCYDLLYINNFDLYTVSMTLFESTEHHVKCCHFIYILTINITSEHNLTQCHSFSRSIHLF